MSGTILWLSGNSCSLPGTSHRFIGTQHRLPGITCILLEVGYIYKPYWVFHTFQEPFTDFSGRNCRFKLLPVIQWLVNGCLPVAPECLQPVPWKSISDSCKSVSCSRKSTINSWKTANCSSKSFSSSWKSMTSSWKYASDSWKSLVSGSLREIYESLWVVCGALWM